MKKHLILSAMAVLALGLTACDDTTKTETTEQSNVNGTEIEKTTTTETTTDNDGNKAQEVKTETTVDPEGMMNKQTEEHTETKEVETSQ